MYFSYFFDTGFLNDWGNTDSAGNFENECHLKDMSARKSKTPVLYSVHYLLLLFLDCYCYFCAFDINVLKYANYHRKLWFYIDNLLLLRSLDSAHPELLRSGTALSK